MLLIEGVIKYVRISSLFTKWSLEEVNWEAFEEGSKDISTRRDEVWKVWVQNGDRYPWHKLSGREAAGVDFPSGGQSPTAPPECGSVATNRGQQEQSQVPKARSWPGSIVGGMGNIPHKVEGI